MMLRPLRRFRDLSSPSSQLSDKERQIYSKPFTAAQMRELDRLTATIVGVPFDLLMETAASRVVEFISHHWISALPSRIFTIFCGKGNNGGDGAAIARLLWIRGPQAVHVYVLGRVADIKGDARRNLDILQQIYDFQRSSGQCSSGTPLTITEVTSEEHLPSLTGDLVIIDALLGTGLTRPAEGLYATAIKWINSSKAHHPLSVEVLSVDIPSGLSSDSGKILGAAVRADVTVSFTGPKIGNISDDAADLNGDLIIADIGTPSALLSSV